MRNIDLWELIFDGFDTTSNYFYITLYILSTVLKDLLVHECHFKRYCILLFVGALGPKY